MLFSLHSIASRHLVIIAIILSFSLLVLTGCQSQLMGPNDDISKQGLAFTVGNFNVSKVDIVDKTRCELLNGDVQWNVSDRWLVTGIVYFGGLTQGTPTSIYLVDQGQWRFDNTTPIEYCRRK